MLLPTPIKKWLDRIKIDPYVRLQPYCIYGELGTGKTTLIRSMVDYLQPLRAAEWDYSTLWNSTIEGAALIVVPEALAGRRSLRPGIANFMDLIAADNKETIAIHTQFARSREVKNMAHFVIESNTPLDWCINHQCVATVTRPIPAVPPPEPQPASRWTNFFRQEARKFLGLTLPKPANMTFSRVEQLQMFRYYIVPPPEPAVPDFAKRIATITITGVDGNVKPEMTTTIPKGATEFQVDGELGEQISLVLRDYDTSNNGSDPSDPLAFTVTDTVPPPKPGTLHIGRVEQIDETGVVVPPAPEPAPPAPAPVTPPAPPAEPVLPTPENAVQEAIPEPPPSTS